MIIIHMSKRDFFVYINYGKNLLTTLSNTFFSELQSTGKILQMKSHIFLFSIVYIVKGLSQMKTWVQEVVFWIAYVMSRLFAKI